MSEVYRKFGSVVRREGDVLLRIDEAGEAIDDGVFRVRPIASDRAAPPLDATRVNAVADALMRLTPERLIVSEGVTEHECDGRRWRDEAQRIHIALTHERMRVLVDHADFEQLDDIHAIAAALRNVSGERDVAPVRLAPMVAASLLSSLIGRIDVEQMPASHDGRGNAIARKPATTPHPNVYRPTYRVRPVAMPFHLRAVPFGAIDDAAPRALAIVNAASLLCVDGRGAFVMPLPIARVAAAGEPLRWYPYGAGSFGAEMML